MDGDVDFQTTCYNDLRKMVDAHRGALNEKRIVLFYFWLY